MKDLTVQFIENAVKKNTECPVLVIRRFGLGNIGLRSFKYEPAEYVDFSGNELTSFDDFWHRFPRAWWVVLSQNMVTDISKVSFPAALGYLDLSSNFLDRSSLLHLSRCHIMSLTLGSNQVQKSFDNNANYRSFALAQLPLVWVLDGDFVSSQERKAVPHSQSVDGRIPCANLTELNGASLMFETQTLRESIFLRMLQEIPLNEKFADNYKLLILLETYLEGCSLYRKHGVNGLSLASVATPCISIFSILHMHHKVRLDLSVLLTASIMFHIPDKLLAEAYTVLLSPIGGVSTEDIISLVELPLYARSAIVSIIRRIAVRECLELEQLGCLLPKPTVADYSYYIHTRGSLDSADLPAATFVGQNGFWFLRPFIDYLSKPLEKISLEDGSNCSESSFTTIELEILGSLPDVPTRAITPSKVSHSYKDWISFMARHAVLMLKKAPSCPMLTKSQSNPQAQSLYKEIVTLLKFAGMTYEDLEIDFFEKVGRTGKIGEHCVGGNVLEFGVGLPKGVPAALTWNKNPTRSIYSQNVLSNHCGDLVAPLKGDRASGNLHEVYIPHETTEPMPEGSIDLHMLSIADVSMTDSIDFLSPQRKTSTVLYTPITATTHHPRASSPSNRGVTASPGHVNVPQHPVIVPKPVLPDCNANRVYAAQTPYETDSVSPARALSPVGPISRVVEHHRASNASSKTTIDRVYRSPVKGFSSDANWKANFVLAPTELIEQCNNELSSNSSMLKWSKLEEPPVIVHPNASADVLQIGMPIGDDPQFERYLRDHSKSNESQQEAIIGRTSDETDPVPVAIRSASAHEDSQGEAIDDESEAASKASKASGIVFINEGLLLSETATGAVPITAATGLATADLPVGAGLPDDDEEEDDDAFGLDAEEAAADAAVAEAALTVADAGRTLLAEMGTLKNVRLLSRYSVDTAISRVQSKLKNHTLRYVTTNSNSNSNSSNKSQSGQNSIVTRQAPSEPVAETMSWSHLKTHLDQSKPLLYPSQESNTFLTNNYQLDDVSDDITETDFTEEDIDGDFDEMASKEKMRAGTGGDYATQTSSLHVRHQSRNKNSRQMVMKTLSAAKLLRLQSRYHNIYTSTQGVDSCRVGVGGSKLASKFYPVNEKVVYVLAPNSLPMAVAAASMKSKAATVQAADREGIPLSSFAVDDTGFAGNPMQPFSPKSYAEPTITSAGDDVNEADATGIAGATKDTTTSRPVSSRVQIVPNTASLYFRDPSLPKSASGEGSRVTSASRPLRSSAGGSWNAMAAAAVTTTAINLDRSRADPQQSASPIGIGNNRIPEEPDSSIASGGEPDLVDQPQVANVSLEFSAAQSSDTINDKAIEKLMSNLNFASPPTKSVSSRLAENVYIRTADSIESASMNDNDSSLMSVDSRSLQLDGQDYLLEQPAALGKSDSIVIRCSDSPILSDRVLREIRPSRSLGKVTNPYRLDQKGEPPIDSNSSLIASVPYKLRVSSPSIATMRGKSMNRIDSAQFNKPALVGKLSGKQEQKRGQQEHEEHFNSGGNPSMITTSTADDFGDQILQSQFQSLNYSEFVPHAAATAMLPLNPSFAVTRPRLASNKSVRSNQFPLPPVSTKVLSRKIIQKSLGQKLGVGSGAGTDDISISALYEANSNRARRHLPARGELSQVSRSADNCGLFLGVTGSCKGDVAHSASASVSIVAGSSNPRMERQYRGNQFIYPQTNKND